MYYLFKRIEQFAKNGCGHLKLIDKELKNSLAGIFNVFRLDLNEFVRRINPIFRILILIYFNIKMLFKSEIRNNKHIGFLSVKVIK